MLIDGSHGEGGGSIVRTAVALSAATGEAIRIENIRSGREKPGLRAQHAEAIGAVAQLCSAKTKGAEVGSRELEFVPGSIAGKEVVVKIPTAGSTGLLLQSFLLAAARKGASLRIEGGATNGKWAAPLLYMRSVLLPLLEKFGYIAEISIRRYGYYPKGGASVAAKIQPAAFRPAKLLDKGRLLRVFGISHASSHLRALRVAERQKEAAEKVLSALNVPVSIEACYVDALNPGSAVDIWALFEKSIVGGDGLGERGVRAEDVGREAAEKLLGAIKSEASVDRHAEDMLIPYMALAAAHGVSQLRVPEFTKHTETNTWLCEKMLPVKFSYDAGRKIISCAAT